MMLKGLMQGTARFAFKLSTLGLVKGAHVTRYTMYHELAKFRAFRQQSDRVLSISHSEKLTDILGYQRNQVTDAAYPEATIFDLPFADEEFDAVVSDQVLEHIEGDPYDAFREAFRVLKPGGLGLHTTVFIMPVHGSPGDFWRYTPDALRLLGEPYGEVLEAGGWGNPYVFPYIALGLHRQPIPHARWHPAHWLATHNRKSWPLLTWVLVRKR